VFTNNTASISEVVVFVHDSVTDINIINTDYLILIAFGRNIMRLDGDKSILLLSIFFTSIIPTWPCNLVRWGINQQHLIQSLNILYGERFVKSNIFMKL
jgi:hypothetical protein